MPEISAEKKETPVVTPPATPGGPAAPAVGTETPVNWEEKYNGISKENEELKSWVENANHFFGVDKPSYDRLNLYVKAMQEGKPYEELLKTLETPSEKKEVKESGFDPEAIKKLIQEEIKPYAGMANAQAATLQEVQSKESLLKQFSWAKPEDFDEYKQRFEKFVDDKLAQVPIWQRGQAKQGIINGLAQVPEEMLFSFLMQDKRDSSLVNSKRPRPEIPKGMLGEVKTGTEPELLDQAKKVFKTLESNPGKIGEFLKEIAPQFGVDDDDEEGIRALLKKLKS